MLEIAVVVIAVIMFFKHFDVVLAVLGLALALALFAAPVVVLAWLFVAFA